MSAQHLSLDELLATHPQLKECFLEVLELAEGNVVTTAEAEERLIECTRKVGKQALQDWAQGQERAQAEDLKNEPNTRRHSKKNSTG